MKRKLGKLKLYNSTTFPVYLYIQNLQNAIFKSLLISTFACYLRPMRFLFAIHNFIIFPI